MDTSRFNIVNFGLATGITAGGALALLAIVARLTANGYQATLLVGKLLPTYAPTFKGAAVGGLWGLVIGFIAGAVLACIYNQLQARKIADG